METTNRLTPTGLISELDSVRGFSFYQLNDLLNRFTRLHNTINEKRLDIRYRAMPSLAFPASDVDSYEWLEGGAQDFLELTVTFMGLYGPASPLPAYYTERVIQNGEADHPSRDLMDLFNHRLISLLQRCWNKYRYFVQYEDGGRDQYSRWLLSLMGMDLATLQVNSRLRWHRLLPFAGVISNLGSSADRLIAVVKYYFGIKMAWIEPWVERNFVVPDHQCNRMGLMNSAMGDDLILGDEIRDCSGKFNLHLERLSPQQHENFLPDGTLFHELVELIRFTLQDPLDFDLYLTLEPQQGSEDSQMQKAQQRLGWTFQLGVAEGRAVPVPTCICVADYSTC